MENEKITLKVLLTFAQRKVKKSERSRSSIYQRKLDKLEKKGKEKK